MLMTEYLKQWAEDKPKWLADYHTGDKVAFSDFLSGRIGYYPGAGFDGCLVEVANQAHCVHSFLYVDFGPTREEVEDRLRREDAFMGYHSIGSIEWSHDDLIPYLGQPVPSDLYSRLNASERINKDNWQPFCIMEIYERNEDKDDSWGAERFALAYLCSEGIETYYQLFVMQYKKAPWLFLAQNHGFGGIYGDFGFENDGILHGIIHKHQVLPEFVISGSCVENMWDGYHLIEDVEPVIGGMWKNTRALYRRNV